MRYLRINILSLFNMTTLLFICPTTVFSQLSFLVTPVEEVNIYPNPIWLKYTVINISPRTIYLLNYETLTFPIINISKYGTPVPGRNVHLNELPQAMEPGEERSKYVSLDTYGSDKLSWRYRILDTGKYVIHATLMYRVLELKQIYLQEAHTEIGVTGSNYAIAGEFLDSLRRVISSEHSAKDLLRLYVDPKNIYFRGRITAVLKDAIRHTSEDAHFYQEIASTITSTASRDPACTEIMTSVLQSQTSHLIGDERRRELRKLLNIYIEQSRDSLLKASLIHSGRRLR